MEGHCVRSLSELADNYDECAKALEATAEIILAGLSSSASEIRGHQGERADWLTAEATGLRARAAELRKVETGMVRRTTSTRDRFR
jgi:cell division septum initiation protein DivIVA